jgi:uncharacterized protein (UPF0332 family)
MTMEPSPEYVRRQLQLADEALDDARYLLQGNRLKATANRAYYAMFYAAMAALLDAKLRTPKSHSGTIALFGKHYVVTGKIDRQFGRDLRNAYNLRQQSDYEMFANIGEEQVREALAKAQVFVAEVKRLLE